MNQRVRLDDSTFKAATQAALIGLVDELPAFNLPGSLGEMDLDTDRRALEYHWSQEGSSLRARLAPGVPLYLGASSAGQVEHAAVFLDAEVEGEDRWIARTAFHDPQNHQSGVVQISHLEGITQADGAASLSSEIGRIFLSGKLNEGGDYSYTLFLTVPADREKPLSAQLAVYGTSTDGVSCKGTVQMTMTQTVLDSAESSFEVNEGLIRGALVFKKETENIDFGASFCIEELPTGKISYSGDLQVKITQNPPKPRRTAMSIVRETDVRETE